MACSLSRYKATHDKWKLDIRGTMIQEMTPNDPELLIFTKNKRGQNVPYVILPYVTCPVFI